MANVGEVKNRGFEASLSAYIIRDHARELNWMVSGQLVYDKNWVSKLSEAIKEQNEAMLADEDYEVANLFYEGRPQNGVSMPCAPWVSTPVRDVKSSSTAMET